ncbi:MAG: metallophosphoesterase [Lentisphaeria bacterium]|nr:metallophosphoesterase [Lentisphaeria bacterium]
MKKILIFVSVLTVFILAAQESYSFYLLSDLHLGAPGTYDPKRFRGNIHRAELALPAYEKMFAHMMKTGQDAKFVMQLGDMVEGNTKGEKEHTQQLSEAIGFLKKNFSIPVYHVLGNHDAYGPGGVAAYNAVLLPEMARMVNKKSLKFANYSFFQGRDIFIVVDYTRRANGKKFILDTLNGLKEKPRYVFIAIHTPLIALNGTEFADILARYNAVVFSGHIHTNYLLRYSKKGKTMTQITVSSWLPAKNAGKQYARINSRNPEVFKEHIRYQAKKFKKPSFMAVYEKEWEPYLKMTHYKGNGYLKVTVSGKGLTLLRQGADITKKPVVETLEINK